MILLLKILNIVAVGTHQTTASHRKIAKLHMEYAVTPSSRSHGIESVERIPDKHARTPSLAIAAQRYFFFLATAQIN
jgi:hypothetical protein